jgi:hypothetical protein
MINDIKGSLCSFDVADEESDNHGAMSLGMDHAKKYYQRIYGKE